MRRARLLGIFTILLGLFVLISFSARADESRKTLDRTEDLVVLTGAELPKLKGVLADHLRVYAARGGALVAIPFQVDERTPGLDYCWRAGPDPVKDVDDGRLDDDDELVFRAADTGDRTSATVAGATVRIEVEVEEPSSSKRAWAYVLVFDDKDHPPPPRATARHVELVPDGPGGARLRTETFEVASVGSFGLAGRPRGLRLRAADGTAGPELVKDAAVVELDARYLLAHITRSTAEARTSLGSSWIDGPVRLIVPATLESYLISGNWVSATRAHIFVHDHTWELHARFAMPVNLDRDHASEARLTFEPGPGARGWPLLNTSGLLQLLGPEAAIGARLELDPRLRMKESAGPAELVVDLTGLRKSEEATPYDLTYVILVLPGGSEASLGALMTTRDKPLRHAAR